MRLLKAAVLLWLSCLQCVAVRLQSAVSRRAAKVAAVIPVYPPHFSFLRSFLLEWSACPQGREAMDVFVVFSRRIEADSFRDYAVEAAEEERAANPPSSSSTSSPYDRALPCGGLPCIELVINRSTAAARYGTFLKSWKKLDGLAQVLELPSRPYDFALMMDAEIGLGSCEGFARLHEMLEKKHAGKTWYGFRNVAGTMAKEVPEKMRRAACAISPVSAPANSSSAAAAGTLESSLAEGLATGASARAAGISLAEGFAGVGCDDRMMARFEKELANFTLNTWWNDIPYVHLDTARRMFDSWAFGLQAALRATEAEHGEGSLSNASVATALPTPTEVTARIGDAPDLASELNYAAGSFEHLVYQLYTVAHEGFSVVDLGAMMAKPPNIVSAGEHFCCPSFGAEDRAVYVKAAEPLWQAFGCAAYQMPYGLPLLIFHRDRGIAMKGRC